MQYIGISDLPEGTRVKLSAKGVMLLWDQVDDQGGITCVAQQYSCPRSKLYNWRHKESFLPAAFVHELLDDADQYVIVLKGGGRSVPITLSEFPLPIDEELLTRIACSVHVNREGVPLYQAQDAGLVNRFIELLQQYGNVPISVYYRTVYELRYPKYLQDIFETTPYEEDFAALVDEQGGIEDSRITVNERSLPVQEFDGKLFHRGKKLQLALARGDTTTITQLMASEAEKVRHLVQE